MKLATLKQGGRDGTLVVVNRDLTRAQAVPAIAPTLQHALDHWDITEPQLREVYAALNNGHARHAIPFDPAGCHSPLPRAYQWADGSAYVNHVELVRKARNADMPSALRLAVKINFCHPVGPLRLTPWLRSVCRNVWYSSRHRRYSVSSSVVRSM